jgi:hypothetical protein
LPLPPAPARARPRHLPPPTRPPRRHVRRPHARTDAHRTGGARAAARRILRADALPHRRLPTLLAPSFEQNVQTRALPPSLPPLQEPLIGAALRALYAAVRAKEDALDETPKIPKDANKTTAKKLTTAHNTRLRDAFEPLSDVQLSAKALRAFKPRAEEIGVKAKNVEDACLLRVLITTASKKLLQKLDNKVEQKRKRQEKAAAAKEVAKVQKTAADVEGVNENEPMCAPA